jgi:hypothetical protein
MKLWSLIEGDGERILTITWRWGLMPKSMCHLENYGITFEKAKLSPPMGNRREMAESRLRIMIMVSLSWQEFWRIGGSKRRNILVIFQKGTAIRDQQASIIGVVNVADVKWRWGNCYWHSLCHRFGENGIEAKQDRASSCHLSLSRNSRTQKLSRRENCDGDLLA